MGDGLLALGALDVNHVPYRDPYLGAPLLNELLRRQLRLRELLRLLTRLALLVRDNLKKGKKSKCGPFLELREAPM